MLQVGVGYDTLSVVADQHGILTSAEDLARAMMTIAVRLLEDDGARTSVLHVSNAGAKTLANFATEAVRQSSLRGGPWVAIEPIAATDYPTPARRLANSRLSHLAIRGAYGIELRDWRLAERFF